LTPVRILLSTVPPFMGDMIERLLATNDDLEVVGRLQDAGLADAVGRTDPDCVIAGMSGEDVPPECRELVDEGLRPRVLAVAREGTNAVVYELVPHTERIGVMTPALLLDLLRGKSPDAAL
jgi:DNA-binding NarL/FixJ family response regulator